MLNNNFLLGFAAGLLGVYVWNKVSKKAGKSPTQLTATEIVKATTDVIKEESGKFSEAVKREYNIVMPSDIISNKAKKKAEELKNGRTAIKAENIKSPMYL